MKGNNKIQLLINSLSGGEIRNFKIYASRHIIGNSNFYMKLFGVFKNHSESLSDLEVCTKLNMNPKKLMDMRKYLYDLIIKSLRIYNANNFGDIIIYNQLIDGKLLIDKALYDLAEEELIKAQKLAEISERFDFLIIINEMLSVVLTKKLELRSKNFDYLNLMKRSFKAIELYQNKLEYNYLNSNLDALKNKNVNYKNKSELISFKDLRQSILLSSPDQAKSIRAKNQYYMIKAQLNAFIGNKNLSLKNNISRLNLIQKNTSIFSFDIHLEIIIISSCISDYIDLNQLPKARKLILKLQTLKFKTAHLNKFLREKLDYCQLRYFIASNCDKEGYLLTIEIYKKIGAYTFNLFNQNIGVYFMCCYFSIINNDILLAKKYIAHLYNYSGIKLKPEENLIGFTIYMIIMFLLKDLEFMLYLQRKLKKLRLVVKDRDCIEIKITDFLIEKAKSEGDYLISKTKIINKIENIFENKKTSEKNRQRYFNYRRVFEIVF
jgi:hypothetical protein